MHELIAGPNFSGRSAMLMARLRARASSGAFFVGPYAEAALSGLASTVADEIAIYRAPGARPVFAPVDFAALAARKPATLSGGEQVLLALHCFSQSKFGVIGIDTALEQLDAQNRKEALRYLASGDFDALLIDNRIDDMQGWSRVAASDAGAFACDLSAFGAHHRTQDMPAITIEDLSFRYRAGRDIFRDLHLTLDPGHAYRLTGPNGAGKTTLFKLLAGVLVPASGRIALDGKTYAPWRDGNRVFAYATQNPDHQWCGATLAEDLARRRAALARTGIEAPTQAELFSLADRFGIAPDQHLYELPIAARKRLTWLWPLSGVMPWIMLDEPTVGQDGATRTALAAAVTRLTARGHGVAFITHDGTFADAVAHRALLIDDAMIRIT